jgi:hypothetical protein
LLYISYQFSLCLWLTWLSASVEQFTLPSCLPNLFVYPQGSHFYFEGVKLAQGRDNVLAHLKDNPDTAARLTTAVQAKIAELGALAASGSSSGARSGGLEDDDEDFGDELLDDDALLQELREIGV